MKILFYESETDTRARVTRVHHQPHLLTEAKRADGIEVESLPAEPSLRDGQRARLFVNPQTAEAWYEVAGQAKPRMFSVRSLAHVLGIVEAAQILEQVEGKINAGQGLANGNIPPRAVKLAMELLQYMGTAEDPGGIDLDHPDAAIFIQTMVADGLMSQDQADRVLAYGSE